MVEKSNILNPTYFILDKIKNTKLKEAGTNEFKIVEIKPITIIGLPRLEQASNLGNNSSTFNVFIFESAKVNRKRAGTTKEK